MEIDFQTLLATALTKYATAVRKLSDSEIQAFVRGDYRIDIVTPTSKDSKRASTADALPPDQLAQIVAELRNMDSREDGTELLRASCRSKHDLIAIAKLIDIPIQKRENIDRVIEKIVEATIGFRLRSKAIQGNE